MRLIDGDELLKNLEKVKEDEMKPPIFVTEDTLNGVISGIEYAEDVVEHSPTIGGWISVKDRLPGNEFVLVSVVKKNTGHRWETPTIGEIVHGKWFLETEGTIADNVGVTVTHWMPLPEPPKEVTGE